MSDWTRARVVGHNAADVWDWSVTSLGEVRVEGDDQSRVVLAHSKAGHWPIVVQDGTAVEGNPWLVALVNGEWLCATWEWLRPGQIRKTMPPDDFRNAIKAPEFIGWSAENQLVGFFVSTLARGSARSPVQERSNVSWWDYRLGQPSAGPGEPPLPPDPEPPSDDLAGRVTQLEARMARLEARFRSAGEIMAGL